MANQPPPLPPRRVRGRTLSQSSNASSTLSPDDCYRQDPWGEKRLSPSHPYGNYGGFNDPRSSSVQSLRPEELPGPNRRTLLIVYIHGFLGNETSFRSFPAHVHMLLTMTLSETHVVYTKIYPRYKSRGNVTTARDDFSLWLEPHEAPSTDVILVGHSLGGIVGAEVVLLPAPHNPNGDVFRHRIIGLIAYDTPFLGMHPGVVSTGITSLFRPAPPPPASTSESQGNLDSQAVLSPISSISDVSTDPNYNPSYANDVRLANRQGTVNRAMYFWNKHCGELASATRSYVTSHLEFGGCLADYQGLRKRYNAIRSLEDVEENGQQPNNTKHVRRVRFVNYYSASTGRIKERPASPSPSPSPRHRQESEDSSRSDLLRVSPRPLSPNQSSLSPSHAFPPSPRISVEEHLDGEVIPKELQELEDLELESPTQPLDDQTQSPSTTKIVSIDTQIQAEADDALPPIPDLPQKPDDFDEKRYTNKDTLKLAKKEHAQQVKAYDRAVKDRDKIIKRREKFVANRKKAEERELAKKARMKTQEDVKNQKEKLKRTTTMNPDDDARNTTEVARLEKAEGRVPKKQRDRKFCTLPKKDPQTGERDSSWIRVYMEGIDEVVAHTSMFVPGEVYSKLVGDTVERIEKWMHDAATTRAVAAFRG